MSSRRAKSKRSISPAEGGIKRLGPAIKKAYKLPSTGSEDEEQQSASIRTTRQSKRTKTPVVTLSELGTEEEGKTIQADVAAYKPDEALSAAFASLTLIKNVWDAGGRHMFGMTVDNTRSQLYFRGTFGLETKDKIIPVHDFDGNFLRNIQHNHQGEVAIDTRRQLLLLPELSGILITKTLAGGHVDRLNPLGKNRKRFSLHGIAYNYHNDVYMTSSSDGGQVYTVQPETGLLLNTFTFPPRREKKDRKSSCKYTSPQHLCYGMFLIDGELTPVTVVSQYTLTGYVVIIGADNEMLHAFGREDDLQFSYPSGVCLDPSGRLMICDYINDRVVSVWIEEGKERWQTLIAKERHDTKSHPFGAVCDFSTRKLFIMGQSGELSIFQC